MNSDTTIYNIWANTDKNIGFPLQPWVFWLTAKALNYLQRGWKLKFWQASSVRLESTINASSVLNLIIKSHLLLFKYLFSFYLFHCYSRWHGSPSPYFIFTATLQDSTLNQQFLNCFHLMAHREGTKTVVFINKTTLWFTFLIFSLNCLLTTL